MQTEAQARELWCPMFRAGVHGINTPFTGSSGCLASGCMMWRWTADRDTAGKPITGYCGLAGKPT